MTIDEAIKEIKRWTGILMFHGNRCDVETAEAQEMAIKALEELQQYRTLGTPEELKELKERAFTGVELAQIAAMQMKLKEYEKTGTTEECRAAVEKRDRDRKNVRKDTKLTYRELAEYCETRADCSRCEKYKLCERLSDYAEENLAPAEVVKMVDSEEKLS